MKWLVFGLFIMVLITTDRKPTFPAKDARNWL
jgi:hypothetical protein